MLCNNIYIFFNIFFEVTKIIPITSIFQNRIFIWLYRFYTWLYRLALLFLTQKHFSDSGLNHFNHLFSFVQFSVKYFSSTEKMYVIFQTLKHEILNLLRNYSVFYNKNILDIVILKFQVSNNKQVKTWITDIIISKRLWKWELWQIKTFRKQTWSCQ